MVLQWAAVLVDEHGSRTEWLFPKVSMSRLSSSVVLVEVGRKQVTLRVGS